MWKNAEPVAITMQDRRAVRKLASGRNTAQKVVLRAKIVLGAADGTANNALAKRLGTSRPTVLLWRERFQQGGVEALLRDAPRPVNQLKHDVAEGFGPIVERCLAKERGQRYGSARELHEDLARLA